MKTITLKEIADWAKLQPPNRHVNMSQCAGDYDPCGCLMVQYGKEHGIPVYHCSSIAFFPYVEKHHNGKIYRGCGEKKAQLDKPIWHLFKKNLAAMNTFDGTFGELVQMLKEEYQN